MIVMLVTELTVAMIVQTAHDDTTTGAAGSGRGERISKDQIHRPAIASIAGVTATGSP